MDKRVASVAEAVSGIRDGATVLVSGFGEVGMPHALLDALVEQGARELTVVANNAGAGETGISALLKAGRVRRIVCSFPRSAGSVYFEQLYSRGQIELEVVPQGTLSERIRAAAAGIGGFYVKTAAGTLLAEGKEVREIEGETYVFETPIRADVALVKADTGDRWGNLTYHASARNFGPMMAAAGGLTVVQVRRIVELGEIDPEDVITPSIFVDRIVEVGP